MTQLVIQPGPAEGVDTYISGDNDNTNYGTQNLLWLAAGFEYHSTWAHRGLIRLSLVDIPAGAVIQSATLTLYYASTGHTQDNTYTISCYRCPTAWTELGATWNKYDGVNAWSVGSVGGGDWDADIAAVCTDINGAVDLSFDIKSHVEDAIANRAGVLNMLLKITGADDNYPLFEHHYYSSDETTEITKRPKLVIDYIAPAGGMPSALRSVLRPTLRPTIQSAMR